MEKKKVRTKEELKSYLESVCVLTGNIMAHLQIADVSGYIKKGSQLPELVKKETEEIDHLFNMCLDYLNFGGTLPERIGWI